MYGRQTPGVCLKLAKFNPAAILSVKRACRTSADPMACHSKKCTFLLGSVAVLKDMEKAVASMHQDVTLGKSGDDLEDVRVATTRLLRARTRRVHPTLHASIIRTTL